MEAPVTRPADPYPTSYPKSRQTFVDALTVPATEQITLFGQDYLAIPEVSNGEHSEAVACGWEYDFFHVTESGERRFVGRLLESAPTQLADQYLLWEMHCEGGDVVLFVVARVDESGAITRLGTVEPTSIGVRSEYGSHRVNEDGSITFEGANFNGDEFVDTFELSDLLEQLPVDP